MSPSTSWTKIILLSLAVVAALILWSSFASAVPDCASGRETLHSAFNGSQVARIASLSAVDSTGHRELSWDKGRRERSCTASMRLNNGTETTVDYTMTGRDDGNYLLVYKFRE